MPFKWKLRGKTTPSCHPW